jgi:hypothetical protein
MSSCPSTPLPTLVALMPHPTKNAIQILDPIVYMSMQIGMQGREKKKKKKNKKVRMMRADSSS